VGTAQQNAGREPLVTSIDASETGEPISPYMYGMFMENVGDLMNRSLWSEMLEDRKFFFAVTVSGPKEPLTPLTPFHNERRWVPAGAQSFVTMEGEHAYVGVWSPRIALEANTPHGIQQAQIAVVKGKQYSGRVVLAGTAGAKVSVSLVWGDEPGERRTITIAKLTADYAKFPLHFTAGADTEAARLEITGVGSGFFRVGAVSLMPADNVDGFRRDSIRLLRDLNSGLYRVNGGNFLSGSDWRDAVGDPDKRPPVWDIAWGTMQPNDVGFDEWMTLCKLVGAEPYVTVNAGFGEAHSAADLVEYSNGSTATPMGAWRTRNGHPQPYHVKYWNVGNEPYGFWQIGHTDLKFFVVKHNLFAEAMRRVDPSIVIIASGAMPDEMTVTSNAHKITGKIQGVFGGSGDWTGGLLADSSNYFSGISEHWYDVAGERFDPDAKVDIYDPKFDVWDSWVPVNQSLPQWERRPSNRVREIAEEWSVYNQRFPVIEERHIFVAIDEWAYIAKQVDLKLALSEAQVMQEMFRHTDFLRMSAFTQAVSTLSYTRTDATYNANGLMFKIYREHFGTIPVAVGGNSPQPPPQWPVGGDQSRVNAGSPTYPLDVVAALSSNRKFLTIAVVNPTEFAQKTELKIVGIRLGGKPTLWTMTGAAPDAMNVVGMQPQVKIEDESLPDVPEALSVAPLSINIFRFQIM
jgi:alpha-N-arabinofuranosidase